MGGRLAPGSVLEQSMALFFCVLDAQLAREFLCCNLFKRPGTGASAFIKGYLVGPDN